MGTNRAARSKSHLLLVVAGLLALWTAGLGCGGVVDVAEQASALALDTNATTGFEAVAGWTASAGTASSTAQRTQGAAAYQLTDPANETVLTSAPIASTAAAISGIGDPGSTVALDVAPPNPPRNPNNPGSMLLFMRCASRGINNANLGKVDFDGLRPGIYSTVKFAIPASVRQALQGATFSDLIFELKLHSPGNPKGPSISYRFDNLRARSPSTPPSSAGQSVDLVASLSYSPALSTPGQASFPVGVVQVPQSFHVKLGNAGSGTASLELGYGGAASLTCVYASATGGTSYVLSSCTGGVKAGDLVGADFARLTLLGGSAAAGTTKVRAQLAENPVGDVSGAGIIPPMPTFWGDTPEDSSDIVTAYFNAVNAPAKTEERFISTPVPESARRLGTGAPYDNLTGPPPPNDPPFDKEGHMNRGGKWDAYWRLAGNLSADNSALRNTAHFEAALSANAVVWGHDVNVVSLQTTVDTDNGEVSGSGFLSPSASGSLHLYVFGAEIPGGGSASPSTGFNFNASTSTTYDLPPIPIWIFSVKIGLNASASVAATGTLSFGGFSLTITPQASVGVHIEADFLGIVGVSTTVDFIAVSTPMTAKAFWVVSTDPGVCNAALSFALDGKLTISSLGGHVDLVATIGICPVCLHESWTLLDWTPRERSTTPLFHEETTNQLFPLPPSLCLVPLHADIRAPTAGQTVTSAIPVGLSGSAYRPGSFGPGPGPGLIFIDCGSLIWTSDDPSDTSFPTTGCNPTVVFGTPGPRTLTLTATDEYGETGSATQSITVAPTSAGPQPFISNPILDLNIDTGSHDQIIPLEGGVLGGTDPVVLSWSATNTNGLSLTLGTGATSSLTIPYHTHSIYTVTLTATDAGGNANTATVQIFADYLR